tara:strand:- start:887 stop:1087 length:201 start_codon:yes stop_codon:yes gene_type:complete
MNSRYRGVWEMWRVWFVVVLIEKGGGFGSKRWLFYTKFCPRRLDEEVRTGIHLSVVGDDRTEQTGN